MKKTLLSIVSLLITLTAFAQVRVLDQIRLYDGASPGMERSYNEILENGVAKNVCIPTLTAYLPDPARATGSAMIVCPGGAYISLEMDNEGSEVAKWLADKGIAAFVLKYRTRFLGDTPEEIQKKTMEVFAKLFGPAASASTPSLSRFGEDEECVAVQRGYEDGLRAMEILKTKASEYGINPDKIGIMGFSAGAVVAMNVGMNHSKETAPALVAPIYLGWVDPVSVPDDAAPLYLASPQNDMFPASMPQGIYNAWTDKHIPAEIHTYTGVSHGFGMRNGGYTSDGWIEGLYRFMKYVGFVRK